MAFLARLRTNIFLARVWLQVHTVEIVLAAVFALPFAYFIGAYLERPDPFIIYVVADSDTNPETLNIFREKTKGNLARIGDVDVIVKLIQLPDNLKDTVERVAEDLSNRPDTLMVVGSGRSQLAEESLPIYFTANPRVPYLATTASDDDLLSNCDDKCYEWGVLRSVVHKVRFAPLLQLSPTNKIQASSAIEFAIENNKHRFLIVYGNDSRNKSYADNLVKEYEDAIQGAAGDGAVEVNKVELNGLPEDAKLASMKPECILYAGNFGQGQWLFNRMSHLRVPNGQLLMILSDSVIQTRGTDAQLSEGFKSDPKTATLPVRFTHPTFAADYNHHVSTYDRDAFAIAKALIDDLNERGIDVWMRLKSLFHIHSGRDARRNINRIMKENNSVRTWYLGEPQKGAPSITYIFKGHNQYNGLFHVWKLQGVEMEDVDHWHPGRGIASAQESASLGAQTN